MRKALVVGINNYPKAKLKGCVNDATEFADIIKTNGDASPNFSVRQFPDVKIKSDLKGHIDELFKGDCETALFYFSGHGFINDIGGYIVTPDYKRFDEGVSMDEILIMANKSKAKNKVIILDCCYSGKMGSPQIVGGNNAHIGDGVSILTASRDNETAIEINGHGVFTNLLLNALSGGAADIRGNITPGSIYAYIDQALGAWQQRPVFKTNITQFVSLRTITPQVPLDILRKLIQYFPTAEEEFPLDPSYEDTNAPVVQHEIIEPYAKKENVQVFKHLQKFQSVGLVVPVKEPYMYFAAMKSASCKLTPLGYHYWRLVKEGKI